MGMFDTFCSADGKVKVQTKIGPNLMYMYSVGDVVHADFPDAVIAGLKGFIVIHERRVCSVTEEYPANAPAGLPCITKWGGPFDPEREKIEDFNPIANAIRAMREP